MLTDPADVRRQFLVSKWHSWRHLEKTETAEAANSL